MEVYFLKKLNLHRSDIRGRNESQNIERCSGAKLHEPLLIPPLAPPKPISFYPSPFLSAQDQFQPIMAHFPPPFSWPKPKPNAATHFPFLFFSFLFFPPLAHHFPLSSPMLPAPLTATLPPAISPLQPPLPSLSLFFSHANSHHPTCPSLFPFSSPCFLHEQPPKHPPHLQISCQNTLLAAP